MSAAMQPETLFDPEDLLRWVVEVDEIFLNSTGAQGRDAMDWWALHSGSPGIAARTTYVAIFPPGAFLYIRCDDQEGAEWLRGVLVERGLHPKGVTVRELGRLIRCRECDKRRPLWVTTRGRGRCCRPCWKNGLPTLAGVQAGAR